MTADSPTLKEVIEYSQRMGRNTFALEYAGHSVEDGIRLCVKRGIQDDPARHHPAAVCYRCSDGVEVGRPWWTEVRKDREGNEQ